MEIRTTMVRFKFPKSGMQIKTETAQLFEAGNAEKPTKIWIPLSKLIVEDDPTDDTQNIVTLAKWLFLKGELPRFVNSEEFVHTEIVDKLN